MSAPMLSEQPTVDPSAMLKDSTLGRYTEVGPCSSLVESQLGDYSYVMEDCDLMYTRVGKFCSIASNVRLNPSNHPIWRATQHHFTYRSAKFGFAAQDEAGLFDWRREHPVTLGHDVWAGHGVIVLPGVSIGVGAVLGAGAVVTKDVPDYAVAVGVPAKVVKYRFAPEVRAELLRIAWWDWPHEEIGRALEDFRALDGEAFVRKYG